MSEAFDCGEDFEGLYDRTRREREIRFLHSNDREDFRREGWTIKYYLIEQWAELQRDFQLARKNKNYFHPFIVQDEVCRGYLIYLMRGNLNAKGINI